MNKGYFGIGIENVKYNKNIGVLWRSASILGASFIFTIGERYNPQKSDTLKSYNSIPLYSYENFEEFHRMIPYDSKLIGVELIEKSTPINNFIHPTKCVYLLGGEDCGLSQEAINECNEIIKLPGEICLNVSVAGSLIMFDRNQKLNK